MTINTKVIAEYRESTGIVIQIIKVNNDIKAIVKGRGWELEIPASLAWRIVRDHTQCSVWQIVSYKPYKCVWNDAEVYISDEYVDLIKVY
jgi:hypothetical protein